MRKNILPVILTVPVLVCGCAGMGQKTGSGNEPDSSASLETAENGGKFSDAQASGETGGMEISDSFGNGINEFGWMLYDKMQGSDNLFYSPYSIESALMMAASGAAGKTQEQMYSVLGVSDTDSFMNDYYNFRNLKQSEKAELTTANSIWADSSSIGSTGQINADYGSKLKNYMGTEIFPVDFSGNSEEVNKKITDWVNKNTEGLLPDYHSQAGPDSVMDLVNAVYFYGEWQDSFKSEDTYEQMFLGKTSEKEVEMMHKSDADFKYYDNNHFKGLEMPYADSSIVMDLIISSDGEAVNAGEEWAELADSEKSEFIRHIGSAEEQTISSVCIPKFTADITASGLKEQLEALGIEDAFDPSLADFSGIADGLYISGIDHRARIEVDEEGSRAAAVTEVTIQATAMEPSDSELIFSCDHPFIFIIRDAEHNVILFTGLINTM